MNVKCESSKRIEYRPAPIGQPPRRVEPGRGIDLVGELGLPFVGEGPSLNVIRPFMLYAELFSFASHVTFAARDDVHER